MSGNAMYSMVNKVNNTVLYLIRFLRIDLKRSHHRKKKTDVRWWMLTEVIVVITLQEIHISNHVTHFKLIQRYTLIVSQ